MRGEKKAGGGGGGQRRRRRVPVGSEDSGGFLGRGSGVERKVDGSIVKHGSHLRRRANH